MQLERMTSDYSYDVYTHKKELENQEKRIKKIIYVY